MVKLSSKFKAVSKSTFSVIVALCMLIVMLPAGIGLLSASATVTPWDGSVDTAFESGSGAQADPYLIATGAQLAYLAQEVNKGNYYGKYFKLTNDINLNDQPWTPIGTAAKPFCGSFDGQGYTISGLAVQTDSTTESAGFFGQVQGDNKTAVKNVTVRGNVSVPNTTGSTGAGGLIGELASGSAAQITNCSFSGTVSGKYNVGGLIGYTMGVGSLNIVDCYTEGTVSGYARVAGFIGCANPADRARTVTITGCGSSANLANEQAGCGGLIGLIMAAGTYEVQHSYVANAQIGSVAKRGTGGLIGRVQANDASVIINNCYVAAKITGYAESSGGLFGDFDATRSGSSATITNSHFVPSGTANSIPPVASKINDTPVTATNVYVLEGNYTSIPGVAPDNNGEAALRTAEDFANGTVTALLNTPAITDDTNLWADGSDGYPVFAVLPELDDLTISKGSLTYDKEIKEYSVTLGNGAGSVTVTPTAAPDVAIKVNGAPVESGTASEPITLVDNDTTEIVVEIARPGNTITYTIEVTCTPTWDGFTVATAYAGGDGTEDDPYQIATAAQLAYLSQQARANKANTSKVYFKLMADIDLGGHNWTPIGLDSASQFAGYFDGNGKTITNLRSTNTTSTANANLGLFGYIYEATIHDLNVTNAVIDAAGVESGMTVTAGGIIGRMTSKSTIYNCTFDGTLKTSGDGYGNRYVGGLVGWVQGSDGNAITACSATGTIEMLKKGRGAGLVGFVYASTTKLLIESSVCAMTIDAPPVDSFSGAAGIVYGATAGPNVTIKNTIFVGKMLDSAIPISWTADVAVATDVYVQENWYLGTDGAAASGAGIDSANPAAREKAASAFTDGTVKGLLAAGAAATVTWADGTTYPVPTYAPATVDPTPPPAPPADAEPTPSFSPEPFANYTELGAGTAENPYKIANKNQLYFLAVTNDNIGANSDIGQKVAVTIGGVDYKVTNYSGKYIVLTADIDWGNEPWKPIGGASWFNGFAGNFDGAGHKISNINCYGIRDEVIGVFGMLYNASVKNLYVENATIKHDRTNLNATGGQFNVALGGIAGKTNQTCSISNCHFNGTIEVTNNTNWNVYTGGIVGMATGSLRISGCSSTGSITSARHRIGGLVGLAYGSSSSKGVFAISGSYSAMALSTSDSNVYSGGLVGTTSGVVAATIANCHFAGTFNHPFPISFASDGSVTVEDDVYFMAGSYTTTAARPTVAGAGIDAANPTAREKSVDEFKNGTVTNLLNATVLGGTSWKNGTNYPVNITASNLDLITQLAVSGGSIKFNPNTFIYDTFIPYSATETVLIPEFADGVTVTVNGVKVAQSGGISQTLPVNVGTVTKIYVQAKKGNVVNSYIINVNRREAPPVEGMWDGSLEPFDTKGKGDDIDNPILIENEAQLAFLAAMVNGETVVYKGKVYNAPEPNADRRLYFQKYFKLTADLKLNDVSGVDDLDDLAAWAAAIPYNNWKPIGQNYDDGTGRFFAGIFDGDNHTIEGMYINVGLTDRHYNTGSGLFGSTNYVTLRNIHIRKSYLTGAQRLGAIVGRAHQVTRIQNCTFDGIIQSTDATNSNSGGLLGDAYQKTFMQSCWTTGRLIGSRYMGGLIGIMRPQSTCEVFNSYSAMEIVTAADTPYVGGLIGQIANTAATINIRRCFFAGTMVSTNNESSPILGLATGSGITVNVKDTYYREGSRTTPVTNMTCLGGTDGAKMMTVEEFKDGTVKDLLNAAYAYGDFWNYKDDQTLGYPVPDGKLLVTDFKSYVDDKEYNDGNWADKFVNKDGGTLIGGGTNDGSGGGSNQYPSGTGEAPIYLAALLLLVASAAVVGFLARKKRSVN